jgi:hypothetical protein
MLQIPHRVRHSFPQKTPVSHFALAEGDFEAHCLPDAATFWPQQACQAQALHAQPDQAQQKR